MNKSKETFQAIFQDLKAKGKLVAPRGQKVLEIENYSYELDPYVRFSSFACRKLNVPYIKAEFMWYLNGDRFDTSIASRASLWKSIINEDGSINSNYGQYIWGQSQQYQTALNYLKSDKDTRRAVILILNSSHIQSNTNDVPCTYSIAFRIRNNFLNMTVHMRSQDGIFGCGNDCPAFSFIHEMMLNSLREFYPDLQYGQYFHHADSFHIYERHFDMLEQLVDPNAVYNEILCPQISGPDEVKNLLKLNFWNASPDHFFTHWLTS